MPTIPGANPRIVWNQNILDFPYQLTRYDRQRIPERVVNVALSGKTETAVLRILDELQVQLRPHDDLQFFRDLHAWWSWAARGNAFSLSFDREDRVDTTINATTTVPAELVSNHNFDTWSSDTDAGSWTEALGTGGLINRLEDLTRVYSGPYSLLFTRGSAGEPNVTQTVTLATSTKYRLRTRVRKVGANIGRIYFRIQNTTTGNYLQEDATWAVTTGKANEPAVNLGASDGNDYLLFELEFTTETTGTSFTVGAFQSDDFAAGEFVEIDWFSILPKQKLTLASTFGIVVGNAYRLREASGLEEEIVVVDGVDSSTVVELKEPVKYTYATGDICRSPDFYPALELTGDKQPFLEEPGLVYSVDFSARDSVA